MNIIYVVSGDEWENKGEKRAAVSVVGIVNTRRYSDVEYARILESLMEVAEVTVENVWVSWCYDGKFYEVGVFTIHFFLLRGGL